MLRDGIDDDVPEPLIPELYMKKITRQKIDNEISWICTECGYKSKNPKGIALHISAKHNIHNDQEKGSNKALICPYCDSEYSTYDRLKKHIFYTGCNSFQDSKNKNDGNEVWIDIRNHNNRNLDTD